jgi:DNA-binding LacI/PurR family transcriptional regulator
VLLSPYFDFSVAAQLEHLGLAGGLGKELGDGISLKVLANQKGGEANAYEAVQAILRQNAPLPDALYTLNDSCALGAIRAVREAGLRIPQDISIAAGSGFNLSGTSAPNLTRSAQPLLQIGETLVEMILDRIERKGASVAGRFLSAPFTGGATTRPEENALLMPGY